jgi:hypothetical protein
MNNTTSRTQSLKASGVRVYELNLFGRNPHREGPRKALGRFVLVAADDHAAFQAVMTHHSRAMTAAARAVLLDDKGQRVATWRYGVTLTVPPG